MLVTLQLPIQITKIDLDILRSPVPPTLKKVPPPMVNRDLLWPFLFHRSYPKVNMAIEYRPERVQKYKLFSLFRNFIRKRVEKLSGFCPNLMFILPSALTFTPLVNKTSQ